MDKNVKQVKYVDYYKWAALNPGLAIYSGKDIRAGLFDPGYTFVRDAKFNSEELRLINERPFVARFSSVIVDHAFPLLITSSDQLLYVGLASDADRALDAAPDLRRLPDSDDSYLLSAWGADTVSVLGESILSCFGSKYFGHKVIYMAALARALDVCPRSDAPVYLFGDGRIGCFFGEIFERMRLDRERIVFIDQKRRYIFEELWVAANPISFGGGVQRTSTELFDSFRSKIGVPDTLGARAVGRRRIFISRKDAAYRKIVNEDEVMRALSPYDFMCVEASRYSLSDLIELLGNAEIIISALGSNLVNCVFAPPGVQVGELVPSFYDVDQSNKNALGTIIRGCGQDYYRIDCDVVREAGVKYSKWDFSARTDNVVKCVEKMLDRLGYGS